MFKERESGLNGYVPLRLRAEKKEEKSLLFSPFLSPAFAVKNFPGTRTIAHSRAGYVPINRVQFSGFESSTRYTISHDFSVCDRFYSKPIDL